MKRMNGRRILALLAVLLVVALLPVAAFGSEGTGQDFAPYDAPKDGPGHLEGGLAALEDAFLSGGRDAAMQVATDRRLFVRGGRVEVEILTSGDDAAAAAAVRAAGGLVVATAPGMVGAEMPLGSLRRLSESRAVWWVQSPAPVLPEAAHTSQGVALMNADDWHAAGFRGQGVDVAVVDSGFEGRAAAKSAGDLPAGFKTKNYCDAGLDGAGGGTPHGTAVAEVIYDLAPDADLWLVCIDNSLDFAKAITWMGANGIDIFNASLGFVAAYPGDGTGTLKGYSNKAEKKGVTWINSAGNYALNHWGGPYTDDWGADGVHEFFTHDEGFSFQLVDGATADIYLRWHEWPAATNNLDLFLYQGGGMVPVDWSTDPQDGTQPPKEHVVFQNTTGEVQTYHIAVQGPVGGTVGTPELDVFFFPTNTQLLDPVDPPVATHSLNDAATVTKVLSVGAVFWQNSQVEPFSSRGPTLSGAKKPDVAGYDGTDSFSYPGGFFGTSSSAPHVAGAAALLLTAFPDYTPAQLRAAIKAHTRDLPPKGMDNDSGKGILDLGAPPAMHTCNGKAATILGSGDADEISGTSKADVIVAFGGDDQIDALGGNDTVCAGGGDDQVAGGTGADRIYGGDGHDQLDGGGGNDRLFGEAGNDELDGGPGTDIVNGGAGTDTCVGEDEKSCEL